MTSTLTLPEPGASATVHGIAGWHTSEDPPPEELVGQRLIVVAGPGEPMGSPEWTIVGIGDLRICTVWQNDERLDLIDLHPGCIVGAVTLADVVPVIEWPWTGPSDEYPVFHASVQNMHEVVARANERIVDDITLPALSADYMVHAYWRESEPPHRRCGGWFDEVAWADWSPGRWAWRFENPKPTTQECPVCNGHGIYMRPANDPPTGMKVCPVCNGDGACPPSPYSASEGLAEFDPGRLR